MVIINETTIGDIFGFNDHDFTLVGINCHTHLGAVDMKTLKLLVVGLYNTPHLFLPNGDPLK